MNVATVTQPAFSVRSCAAVTDYWALTKPEINFLIAIATFAGFYLGVPTKLDGFPFMLLTRTLVGTLLVSSGAGALNQYIERRFDAQMRRTARRPLAAGRIEPSSALWFGILLSLAGGIYLAVAVNALAALLAVLTLGILLSLLHASQAKDAPMYHSRRSAWRHASTNRMGGGIGEVEL